MSQNYDYIKQFNNELPLDLYKKEDIESKSIGNYLNKIQNMTDVLESDINPITCQYKGLISWEDFFRLTYDDLESIDFRRSKVLSELIQYMSDENVIRKDEMETILSLFINDVNIKEFYSDYYFEVQTKQNKLNLNKIVTIINKIKPSWLNFDISINNISDILFILTSYEFPNELKVTEHFTTEDNLPGLGNNINNKLKLKSYCFLDNSGVTDIMTTEYITVDDMEIINNINSAYIGNKVEFLRPGVTRLDGQGVI